jgi:4-diphosphocytidyl-2-C-methyl-D-erythritol kinase
MAAERIRVNAYAKINLSLRVLGRRPDGFHDLQSVFQSLGLHDTLILTARPGPFEITCTDARVPTGKTNLVWPAAEALWAALGRSGTPRDVQVAIRKRIPMQAGLGGGSADAAAALVGLSRLWSRGRHFPDFHQLAAGIGADAAYFLMGGTALALGRGDDLYPLEDLERMDVVLALPTFGVSTAEAYTWFDDDVTGAAARRRRFSDSIAAWPRRSLVIENDLEPPVASRHPEITELARILRRHGAAAAAMTGSGSAVFGLFDDPRESVAAAVAVVDHGCRALLAETLGRADYAKGARPVALRA